MQRRRTVVVTGGSSGIGLSAAVALARSGDEVILLGRHPGRLARAVDAVRDAGGETPPAYRADFTVLDEVRAVGARIAAEHERIDVLANNAGQLAPAHRRTVDGHDPTMQSNHLAGFLLTHLLLDRLRAAAVDAPARVVTTSSVAEVWGWLDVEHPGRAPSRWLPSRWLAYGSSKQANILFTVEAARRWASLGIVATSYFPGLIQSRFGSTSPLFSIAKVMPVLFRSPEQGADTLVWLAHDPAASTPGVHYAFRRPFPASPRATDVTRARRLWLTSLAAVGLPPP
jgi:NAD(P)-dependent dehydrogenase (short-subunit alcohol dehydrogenase family)